MNPKVLVRELVVVMVLVCVSAALVRAEELVLQEKLSEDVTIQLENVTIARALNEIGQSAEVKIVLSDEAVWKLPRGEATVISVELEGALAQSMAKMLDAFFMRYAIGDDQITIYPRPELEHILGRPTAKQLQVLRAIYTKRIIQYNQNARSTISGAIGEDVMILPYPDVQEKLDDVFRRLAAEPEPDEVQDSFELAGPVTVKHILDLVMSDEDGHEEGKWYLSGTSFDGEIPELHVVELEQYAVDKLNQVVDLSYKPERADVILRRLAKRAGMVLRVETEDLSWLSEEISVNMQNTKLRNALQNIIGMLDGEMDIDDDDGVLVIQVHGPIHDEEQDPTEPRQSDSDRTLVSDGYVGKISIPMDGGKYYIEFMLREGDLTEELKKLREEKIREILGKSPKPAEESEE